MEYPQQTLYNAEHRLVFLQEYKKLYTMKRIGAHLKEKGHSLYQFAKEVYRVKYPHAYDYGRLPSIL